MPFGVVFLFVVANSARSQQHGAVRRLAEVTFAPDDDVACLTSALEKGDPGAGASTFILKAPPHCAVPAHYHTAEEQLMVVRGEVTTGMEGMSPVVLSAGGFAAMPSKAIHWFSCASREGCLMFVTFDRRYDIFWVKQEK
jgi:quercetin dioxygenase-like cupin family protein